MCFLPTMVTTCTPLRGNDSSLTYSYGLRQGNSTNLISELCSLSGKGRQAVAKKHMLASLRQAVIENDFRTAIDKKPFKAATGIGTARPPPTPAPKVRHIYRSSINV